MSERRAFHQFATQTSFQRWSHIGLLAFVELHRRIHGSRFGKVPEPLKEDAFAAGGYCLDAPGTIPSGGMYYDEFAPPDEDGERNWVATPFTWSREDE